MPPTPPDSPLLIVEDDDLTRAFLVEHLAADGYDPLEAATLADALEILETTSPCLVLSDLTLPDGTGLDLVERIRSADGLVSRVDPRTPIVLLTGRGSEIDRVRGLERGADDYVCKPFSFVELRLRIAALLRRVDRRPEAGVVRVGELVVDPSRRTVVVRGTPVALTQKEYALLLALVREPTRVFAKEEPPAPPGATSSTAARPSGPTSNVGPPFAADAWAKARWSDVPRVARNAGATNARRRTEPLFCGVMTTRSRASRRRMFTSLAVSPTTCPFRPDWRSA
jgi:DNA-binding response OmpR family regulator